MSSGVLLAAVLQAAAPGAGPIDVLQAAAPGAGPIDVLHQHVELEPDFAAKSVRGRTRLTFRSMEPGLLALSFTDNALTLERVTVDGRTVAVERGGGRMTVRLAAPLRRGRRATLEAVYSGRPARGLTFFEGGAYTAYNTCDWTICDIDRPGDKATFSLELTVPAGFTTVATGERTRVRRTADGREVHGWRERRPYSSYLYGFAAARFRTTTLKAGRVELPLLTTTVPDKQLNIMFRDTPAMLAFFEGKAGVPFPHARYTQVLVPGGAAQEASSFSLLGEAQMTPMLKDPQEDWLIAHELAHQWWGNLVTNESWAHFWLNEGITTFMVAAWKEHRWGRAAYEHEMTLARGRRARAAEAGFDKPLAYAGDYPSLSVRRAITYSKGALFMDQLRRTVGEARFWAGLRRFTRAHAGGRVTSRDFQRAMQAESATDLAPLFDEWVHPAVSENRRATRP